MFLAHFSVYWQDLHPTLQQPFVYFLVCHLTNDGVLKGHSRANHSQPLFPWRQTACERFRSWFPQSVCRCFCPLLTPPPAVLLHSHDHPLRPRKTFSPAVWCQLLPCFFIPEGNHSLAVSHLDHLCEPVSGNIFIQWAVCLWMSEGFTLYTDMPHDLYYKLEENGLLLLKYPYLQYIGVRFGKIVMLLHLNDRNSRVKLCRLLCLVWSRGWPLLVEHHNHNASGSPP